MTDIAKKQKKFSITKNLFDAVIFDLDGVVTETAKVHAEAWKRLFDEFLKKREESEKREFVPFDKKDDYLKYVDGKPRYQGVKNFLESRSIELPYGQPEDKPGKETVCGLGNKKNKYFNKSLKEQGVEVYSDTKELIAKLKKINLKIAIISSSKNCIPVLENVAMAETFDAKVDGIDSQKLGIKGKPEPDIFIEAARQLQTDIKRCVVVEDAIAGVQAANKGNFGYVIGVARNTSRKDLKKNGADIVVSSMDELFVDSDVRKSLTPDRCSEQILNMKGIKRLAVFLDYDGTLTPIVEKPEMALLSDNMRRLISHLAEKSTLAVISGRDLEDVRKKVGINNIFYAGSHGFDIQGPDGSGNELTKAEKIMPKVKETQKKLKEKLCEIEGIQFEDKKFSFAVHYRRIKNSEIKKVKNTVYNIAGSEKELKISTGKKILEIQPDIDWDKGKALLWLMDYLNLSFADTLCLYLGDDVTDEDAFEVLKGKGVSILVSDFEKESKADFILANTEKVRLFLKKLDEKIQG